MVLVAQEIENLSPNYDGTFESGVFGLMLYLHTAIFHEFFEAEVTINENTLQAMVLAMNAFAENSNIWNVTSEALQILSEYLIILDFPGLRHLSSSVSSMKTVLRNLVVEKNWLPIVSDQLLLYRYSVAHNAVFFYLFRGMVNNDEELISILEEDEEFIQLLTFIAQDVDIANSSMDFMIGNAVNEALRIYTSINASYDSESYIVELIGHFPRLSANWLRLITALSEQGNCAAYGLCEDVDELRNEIELLLFPNTWSFDDGKLVMRTPLSFSEAQELYYASKQVRSQFFRLLGDDSPVQEDPNETLTMIVYGSRSAYEDFQTYLYNLGTNNGGIYIERWATFFTYQRTPQESIFTLEELFRHEYVHYLSGRYLLHGFWGETHFFENEEVTWFDEGLAEFLAGSTDSDGVRIRQSQGNGVSSDGSDRLSINDIFSASYNDGFKFYRYGNALFSYWYENDMSTMRQIIDLIRQDDISGYLALIEQLQSDNNLQTNYTNYLDDVFTDSEIWWEPITLWEDASQLSLTSIDQVKNEFESITGNSDVTIDQVATSSIARFSLSGAFGSGDPDDLLDALLSQLNSGEHSNNFDYLAGYYKDVTATSSQYVIQGSLFSCTPTSISYELSEVCINLAADIIPEIAGVLGGTFSSTEGLTINNATGQIDLTSSTPGNYTITYTTTGNCPSESVFDLSVLAIDNASFNYSSSEFCQEDGNPTPTITGVSGGTFSSSSGLSINSSTGEIDLNTSTTGNYTISYTTSGSCPSVSSVDISIHVADDATISYSAAEFCQEDANPLPTIEGTTGGTFSSTQGLTINDDTGEIDLASSTAGDYTITYTTFGDCPSISTADISILAMDDASFSYTSSEFCFGDTNPVPTITGDPGGTFSSTSSGLIIDPVTGEIDLVGSTEGNHTITYTTVGNCPSSSDIQINIEEIETSVHIDGNQLTVVETGASYQWVNCDDNNNPIPGETNQSFRATESGNYAVIVTKNGCVQMSDCQSIVVTSLSVDEFKKQFSIYPNPSGGRLNLDLGSNYTEIEVSIRDLSGRLIKSPGKYQTRIVDFEFQRAGIYILQLRSGVNNQSAFMKVLVH